MASDGYIAPALLWSSESLSGRKIYFIYYFFFLLWEVARTLSMQRTGMF